MAALPLPRPLLAAAAILASVGTASATLRGARAGGLGLDAGQSLMRPDIAAQLFSQVSRSWIRQWLQDEAAPPAGSGPSDDAPRALVAASCSKVATAIIQGSSGDETKVLDYMHEVCSERSMPEADQPLCGKFAKGIQDLMEGDSEFNRNIDPTAFCARFYDGPVAEVAARQRKEAAEAAEKRRQLDASRAQRRLEVEKQRAAERRAVVEAAPSPLQPEPPTGTQAVLVVNASAAVAADNTGSTGSADGPVTSNSSDHRASGPTAADVPSNASGPDHHEEAPSNASGLDHREEVPENASSSVGEAVLLLHATGANATAAAADNASSTGSGASPVPSGANDGDHRASGPAAGELLSNTTNPDHHEEALPALPSSSNASGPDHHEEAAPASGAGAAAATVPSSANDTDHREANSTIILNNSTQELAQDNGTAIVSAVVANSLEAQHTADGPSSLGYHSQEENVSASALPEAQHTADGPSSSGNHSQEENATTPPKAAFF